MKSILYSFTMALFLYAPSFLFAQNENLIILDLEDIICKEAEHAALIHQTSSRSNPFAYQTDMHYQVMRWDIDPEQYFIKGDIDYYFKSNIDLLNVLILDFSDELDILSISRNGMPLNYTRSNDQLLTIHLDKSLMTGDADTINITYEGMPPSNGFGSFEQGTHAGEHIIWTLSEPYGARDWWPAKQDLVDKVDSVDIFITTPVGQLAASNGKLMSINVHDDKLIHHWKHRYPIVNYLIALAVTNYASYSQYAPLPGGDSLELLNYVYPETLEATKEATKASVDIMQVYNELFGLYPFASEKYGHAQFGWGGGEEHQTMSFMGSFSFGLQAHEMAHQWFGDKVTCGSWTDIWLNEGFATYLTGLTYERFSPDVFWIAWKNSTSNSATSAPDGSVFVDDTTNVGRIFNGRLSYNKGAYLVHMMRWIAGDQDFFQACRNYLDSPGTAHAFGRTSELKDHFENVTGRDFDGFMDDWFYGEGYPSYDLRWTQETDSLIVWIGQRQSHPSVSFYEMPVPILVVQGLDTIIYRVEHTVHDQRFSFYTGGVPVDTVGFDPEKWILSRNNTVTQITTNSEDAGRSSIMIYPNPASGKVMISASSPLHHAEIINSTGIKIIKKLQSNSLDLSGLPPGVYALRIFNEKDQLAGISRIKLQ